MISNPINNLTQNIFCLFLNNICFICLLLSLFKTTCPLCSVKKKSIDGSRETVDASLSPAPSAQLNRSEHRNEIVSMSSAFFNEMCS